MKADDRMLPAATAQIAARCRRRDSRSQPNTHRPRNVDSRKKASSPSMASGAPKMLPTILEYDDQFMPNWNSWTRPVTTPMATLMTSSVPKNRVSRRYSGRPPGWWPASSVAGDYGGAAAREGGPMTERYPNISDHGLVGDLQTAALVSTDGSVTWYCCPRFDSPSVFPSLLAADKGG